MVTARELLVAVVVAGVLTPSAGWGQAAKGKTAAAPRGPVEIEEITVTAQKREENIQEIPISVTALTGSVLAEKGTSSVSDLVQSVPNVWVQTGATTASATTFSMRGSNIGDNSLAENPAVGLYVDGAYIAKAQGSNLDIEDLERVEVLRGPQGTLYGKNTIGGAVNLVTRKPTEERSITAVTEVGNYDAFKARLTLNVPLIGKHGFWQSEALGTISLRENVSYRSHEPYVDNRSPTEVKESGAAGFNNLNRVFNMTSVRWQPRPDVTIDYAFEYHRYRGSSQSTQLTHIYPNSLADKTYQVAPGFILPFNPIYPGGLTPYVEKNRVLSLGNSAVWTTKDGVNIDKSGKRLLDDGNHRMHFLTAAWDLGELGPLGSVTVKSIASYRAWTGDNTSNISGSPLHFFDSSNHVRLDTWSEELQWIGTSARVRYVLGAYYYGDHTSENSSQVLLNGAAPSYFQNYGKDSSWAGFSQATWTPPILSDKLSVTAGVRLSYDHLRFEKSYRAYSPRTGVITSWSGSVAGSFGIHGTAMPGLSPMADVSYQWTDHLMTYFRVSRGYLTGVANGRAGDPVSFRHLTDPEKLLSYEAGFKSQWFDNRLRLNADMFYADHKDRVVGVQIFSELGAINSLENAGKTENIGAEVEATAIPFRGLEATLAYAWLNSTIKEWIAPKFDANNRPIWTNPCGPGGVPGVTCNTVQATQDLASERVSSYSPQHTVAVGLTYTAPPTTAGVFSAHLDTFWTAKYFVGVTSLPVDPWNYAVVNGRLQLAEIPLQKGSLDLSVFGKNLFDRKYRKFGFDLTPALGWAVNQYGDPRTFGLGLTYNFSAS
ncbi:MAG: TonB-dependent receptor [Candidatus Binatia bacterium]